MVRSIVLAVCLLATLLAAPRPLWAEAAGAQPGATQLADLELPGPGWRPTSPRRMAAFGSAVIAALLLLLYAYRRQRYVLYWTFSWTFLSAALLVVSAEYANRELGLSMLGLSHVLGIAAALLLVLGADAYRRRPSLDPRYVWGVMPLLIWFALSPVVLGSRAVVVPGYLLTGGILATAAIGYAAVFRRERFLGAALIAGTLLLLAGSYAWIAITLSRGDAAQLPIELPVVNALLFLFAALGMHLLVFEDMTYELRLSNRRLAAAQGELRQLVITDPLTGCHNRRFFEEVIGRERRRHRRYAIPLSLVFIDVDRFKAINDALGHEAGDRVLQRVATFLKRSVREADYVFRWGGDEFLVLISCTLAEARRKAAELKSAFDGSPEAQDLPAGVGLSVGCADVPLDSSDILAIIRQADQRMYEDKAAGVR